jgi:hypothetical protein
MMKLNKEDVLATINQASASANGFRWVSVDRSGQVWVWDRKPKVYDEWGYNKNVYHKHEWWWGNWGPGQDDLIHEFEGPITNWKELCFEISP